MRVRARTRVPRARTHVGRVTRPHGCKVTWQGRLRRKSVRGKRVRPPRSLAASQLTAPPRIAPRLGEMLGGGLEGVLQNEGLGQNGLDVLNLPVVRGEALHEEQHLLEVHFF